jgi:hypothetical protein
MATYAEAGAEIVRLKTISVTLGERGLKARRHPGSLTGAGAAATDNRIQVQDGRRTHQRQAVPTPAQEPGKDVKAWLQYQVGTATVFPNSIATFS